MKYKFIDEKKIWTDKNDFFRFLDIDGKLIDPNTKLTVTNEELLSAYEYMVLSRQQDTYMSQLQRQGRLLTFAPNFGEEALQTAAALSLKKEDWLIPSFRNNAAMLMKGVPLINQFLYWNGNEKGNITPDDVNVFPINIVIATQYSHAAGVAYALKQQKKKAISMTFIGDGGTSEGEFYEAMNLAGVHKWPVVFCINNNQWAISTPTKMETSAATLAAKAVAAGIPALRVDGNDLVASAEVIKEAAEYTREGNGPILVEFITWRQGPHTTSDNPRIYRTKEQEEEKEKWEPMHRIKNFLISQNVWTDEKDEKLWTNKLAEVKQAYKDSLELNTTSVDEVFDHTFAKLTPELEEQKAQALEWESKEGGK
ncbi:pyruvate dehydrogenase (acetyl-transferring) E1 component subunit alpha [Mycoplasma todarodis]|uniref:Pyruvate dehydrogenase E1 component subunit alpha n=1 Tax=Mycoplasma todarodis TaxID=1937191 RepID=A0A4R0XJX9_9MOLU|nr:pyruvate dehydrogenase (acetyl-transferring) E1 component subunit alpha [Mycoplasma todarodis]TCG10956.1 pyruvate dehydrogenase (acetyl-transferring) E1 component subunit alpha [Mycoplasma todarodis]